MSEWGEWITDEILNRCSFCMADLPIGEKVYACHGRFYCSPECEKEHMFELKEEELTDR